MKRERKKRGLGERVLLQLILLTVVNVLVIVMALRVNLECRDLREQVQLLTQEKSTIENRIDQLEMTITKQADEGEDVGEGLAREPHAPGSDITMEDLYYFSEENLKELGIIAKIVYREARGIPDKAQQAAVVWCILNRVDDGTWGDTIEEVATYPNAFAWLPDTPVEEELLLLAADVCERWNLEKAGQAEVGRTLPKDYLYFGGDGERNHFRKNYTSTELWDWSLPSPY